MGVLGPALPVRLKGASECLLKDKCEKTQTARNGVGPLTVREAGETDHKRINELLSDEHPQQAPKRVGHELRMVVE